MARFSDRHGFLPEDTEIVIKHAAPLDLREYIIKLAYECGLSPKKVRTLVCNLLRKREDRNNWTDVPNIDDEIHGIVSSCEWYEVYDIIEVIYSGLKKLKNSQFVNQFEVETNKYFYRKGIGWQLINGKVEGRGSKGFEHTIKESKIALKKAQFITSTNEIHQAIIDLSHRPNPDLTGSIQHSIACLECVLREITGKRNPTLGKILSKHPDLLPTPLIDALKKIWGFSSEQGRHLREGREPSYEEAEFIVAISAAMATYLTKKLSK